MGVSGPGLGGLAAPPWPSELAPPEIEADRRYNETERKIDLPDPVARTLAAVLEPQYAFCRDRFGGALPATWAAPDTFS